MNAREKKARQERAKEEVEHALGPDGKARNERGTITVHAFRKLVSCEFCGGIGYDLPITSCVRDRRGRKRKATYAHADCVIREKGEDAFFALPREEKLKATLDQVGVRVMTKLVQETDEP